MRVEYSFEGYWKIKPKLKQQTYYITTTIKRQHETKTT